MMFHGAWTMSIGGKELHQDTAALLDKINGDIKARLVSKYGMSPETVTQWFAEGREGWLSAQELVDAKLATDIIADPSDVIDFPADALGEIEGRGIGIAAFLNTQTKQEKTDVCGKTDADATTGSGDTNGVTGGANGANDAGKSEPAPDPTGAAYQAGLAAGRAEQAAADAERINAADEQCRKFQSDRDKARAENEKLTAEVAGAKATGAKALSDLTEAHAAEMKKIETEHAAIVADMRTKLTTAQTKCERLVGGGMTFSPDTVEKAKSKASDVDPRNRLHQSLR
jgi:hypothetical protein